MDSDIQLYTSAGLSQPDFRLDPLRRCTGEDVSRQFFWKAETDTIQTYEHRVTSRFVHVDRLTGQFYNGDRIPVSIDRALDHALPQVESSPWHVIWVPYVAEPNLTPFVRSSRKQSGDQLSSAGTLSRGLMSFKVLCGSVGSSVRTKFRTNASYKKTPSFPMWNQLGDSRGAPQPGDLRLADFTRRTA